MVSVGEWKTVWGLKRSYRETFQLQDPAPLKIDLEMRHLDMCPLMSCTKNQGKDVISLNLSGQTSRLKILRYYQPELAATPIKSVNANVLDLQKT